MESRELKNQYALEYENLLRIRKEVDKAIYLYVTNYARSDLNKEKISQLDYQRLIRIIQIVEKHLPKRIEENVPKELSVAEKIIEQFRRSDFFSVGKIRQKKRIEEMERCVPHFALSSKEKRKILSISTKHLDDILGSKRLSCFRRYGTIKQSKKDALDRLIKLLKEYDLYLDNKFIKEAPGLVGEYYDSLRKLRALDRTISEIEGTKDRSYILDEQLNGEILNPDDEPKGPGVLEDYRQDSWGIERVCLDGFQNHLPYDAKGTRCWLHFEIDGKWCEVEEARKAYEQGKKITRVRFADDGVGFSYKNLLFFHSTKSSEDRSAGQFGEGMKLASLASLKLGLGMEFQSRNWKAIVQGVDVKVTNTRENDKEEELKKLAYKIYEYSGEPITGSRTIFNTPTDEFIRYALKLPEMITELNPDYVPVHTCSKGDIVSTNDKGKAYIKGIFVQNIDSLFSYNFNDLEVNPDRNRILLENYQLEYRINEILFNLADKNAMKKILKCVFINHNINKGASYSDKPIHDFNYIEVHFGNNLLNLIKQGRSIPPLWKEAFEEAFSNILLDSKTSTKLKPILNIEGFKVPKVLSNTLNKYHIISMPKEWTDALALAGVPTIKSVLPDVFETEITTGISLDYASGWQEDRILLDAIQNHLPSDSKGKKIVIKFQTKDGLWHKYDDLVNFKNEDIAKIKIADDGIGYDYENLAVMSSSKTGSDSTGKWGEGIKVLSAALLNLGMGVTFRSRDWKAEAKTEDITINEGQENEHSAKGLKYQVTTSKKKDLKILSDGDKYDDDRNFFEASSTTIENPSEKMVEEFRTIKNKVLSLNDTKPIVQVGNNYVLDYFNSLLFVRNILIKQSSLIKYSYHFSTLDINDRDRKNLSDEDIKREICKILSNVDNEQFLFKFLDDAIDLNNQDYLEFTTPFSIGYSTADKWVNVFCSKFGANVAIMSSDSVNQEEEYMCEHLGLNVVKLPKTVAQELKKVLHQKGIDCDYHSKLSTEMSKIRNIPEEEYTDYEKFLIDHLLKYNEILNMQMQKFDIPKKNITSIRLYEGATDIAGFAGFGNDHVSLHRHAFRDLSLLGHVFFHESGHALSGGSDSQALFRDFFAYLLSSIAIQTIDIKKALEASILNSNDEQVKKLFKELAEIKSDEPTNEQIENLNEELSEVESVKSK